jgi:hypothetical protein
MKSLLGVTEIIGLQTHSRRLPGADEDRHAPVTANSTRLSPGAEVQPHDRGP